MKQKQALSLAAIFFVALFFPNFSFAVIDSKIDFITIKTSPETPGPNQDVRVRLESYGVNLGLSRIVWSVDGEPTKEGVGLTAIDVTSKDFGEKTDIVADIFTRTGEHYRETLALVPIEIDILWEADTYTPPFYKGKALPTYNSKVRATAIPRFGFATSNPNMFNYQWQVNRMKTIGQGTGKTSANFRVEQAGARTTIGVTVSELIGPRKGRKDIDIRTSSPLIVFYEDAPLYGVSSRALINNKATLSTNETSVRAVPYFFSNQDRDNQKLLFFWEKGGAKTIANSDLETISLINNSNDPLSTYLSLRIRNLVSILQDAQNGTTVSLPGK